MSAELARAIHVYLARTPSQVMMVRPEDVQEQVEQVNMPGTTDQYPNWKTQAAARSRGVAGRSAPGCAGRCTARRARQRCASPCLNNSNFPHLHLHLHPHPRLGKRAVAIATRRSVHSLLRQVGCSGASQQTRPHCDLYGTGWIPGCHSIKSRLRHWRRHAADNGAPASCTALHGDGAGHAQAAAIFS